MIRLAGPLFILGLVLILVPLAHAELNCDTDCRDWSTETWSVPCPTIEKPFRKCDKSAVNPAKKAQCEAYKATICGVAPGGTNIREVKRGVEDGWHCAWGKEYAEQDYITAASASAASVAVGNPGPIIAYIKAEMNAQVEEIANSLGDVPLSVVYDCLMQSLQQKRFVEYKGMRIKAGVASYNFWGPGRVPLPNHHQIYVCFTPIEGSPSSSSDHPGPSGPQVKGLILQKYNSLGSASGLLVLRS